jgi:sarcosine oxidase/L-pipecolate oxidase
MGRLVADLIEDKLEPALVKKFAVDRVHGRVDQSRSGLPIELDTSQLCSPPDFDLECKFTCHP